MSSPNEKNTLRANDKFNSPVEELSDYFTRIRIKDIEKLKKGSIIEVYENEDDVIKTIFNETRNNFINTLKSGIILAYQDFKFEPSDVVKRHNANEFLNENITIKYHREIDTKLINIKGAKHEGKIITFECEVVSPGNARTTPFEWVAHCDECGEEKIITRKKKIKCERCKEPIDTFIPNKSSDIQNVYVRDLIKNDTNVTNKIIPCVMHDSFINTTNPGDRIVVTGVFRSVQTKKTEEGQKQSYIITIDVISFNKLNEDIDVELESDQLDMFLELIKNDTLEERISYSMYNVGGHTIYDDIKIGLFISMIGSYQFNGNREMIHMLLAGDPSVGKSELMNMVEKISPKSKRTTGGGVTGVGLTAGVINIGEDKHVMAPGSLPLANGGILLIDEFDKMNKDDKKGLHEPMEAGVVRRDVNEFHNVVFPARTTIIANANPRNSQWIEGVEIMDNIDFPSAIVSRFDIIFRILDKPNREIDREITAYMNKIELHGKPDDAIDFSILTAYINHVKKIKPVFNEESLAKLDEYFIDVRNLEQKSGSIPIDKRKRKALLRLSIAYARLYMKTVVDDECVNKAIGMYKKSLASFNMRVDQGMSEAMLQTTFKNKNTAMLEIYDQMQDEDGLVFQDDYHTALAKTEFFSSAKQAKSEIDKVNIPCKHDT